MRGRWEYVTGWVTFVVVTKPIQQYSRDFTFQFMKLRINTKPQAGTDWPRAPGVPAEVLPWLRLTSEWNLKGERWADVARTADPAGSFPRHSGGRYVGLRCETLSPSLYVLKVCGM